VNAGINVRVKRMQGISFLAEELLVSEEGVYSMEFVC
jgi:hypothetical protein